MRWVGQWCCVSMSVSPYCDVQWTARVHAKSLRSCPTLCDPVHSSLPGSSVRGILQVIILEWVAISFSRGSSQPRDWTQVSRIAGRHFNLWATRDEHYRNPTPILNHVVLSHQPWLSSPHLDYFKANPKHQIISFINIKVETFLYHKIY